MNVPHPAPASATVYDVNVLTRWHQLGVVLSLLVLGPALAILLFMSGLDHDWNVVVVIGLTLACMILPPVLVFRSFRVGDRAWLGTDGLYFEKRPAVPFDSLVAYNTDDYLKLTRRTGPPLLIQANRKSKLT